MHGLELAFILWEVIGVLFILLGIYDYFSKKQRPFGLFANINTPPMEDVRGHNRALGKLWIGYGIVIALLGLPFLTKDILWVLLTILGTPATAIAMIALYLLKVEKKYRKK